MANDLITSMSYISTARANLDEADFDDILEKSNLRNERTGLTGLLAFNGLNFMQCLEGEREQVTQCLKIIDADLRHDGMVIFDRRQLAQREFPNWTMAGAIIDRGNPVVTPVLEQLLTSNFVKPQTRLHFESFRSFGRPSS